MAHLLIDHACLYVPFSKVQEEVKFLTTALAPLGVGVMKEPVPGVVGLSPMGFLWISGLDHHHQKLEDDAKILSTHIGFRATKQEQVDACYEAALKAGGKDNGKPGIRSHYHAGYYAAFFYDPHGNNIEVVCHCSPE